MTTLNPRSIRFPGTTLVKGEGIARVRGVSFSRLIVGLLEDEIARVRSDPEFAALVDRLVEEDAGILDRLAVE